MCFKKVILILCVLAHSICIWAQNDSTLPQEPLSHLRISILNCKPGEEVWETFGHACIRIIDSTQFDAERDKIYNYGFFEASEDKTLWDQAFSGRVVDLLDTITYQMLIYEYTIKHRGITELVLQLDEEQKRKIYSYLRDNLRKEKRYYEFDTFYDNCSTRILNMFENVFGNAFQVGQVLPTKSRLTFRDVTVGMQCPKQHKYWFCFAVNMLYASRTDRVMSNKDVMFSPDFLIEGIGKATINGKPIGGEHIEVLADTVPWKDRMNMPFIISLFLSLCAIGAILYTKSRVPGLIMECLVCLISAAIGFIILYTWQLDGEPAWKDNYNILWALPTNILFPFLGRKLRFFYAILATLFIGIALVLHILRVQVMPLLEIVPFWMALLFIFGINIKRYWIMLKLFDS